MTVLDESFINNVLAVDWFYSCGTPISEVYGVTVDAVGSWAESLAYWNSDELNDLHSKQRSRLQLHLINHHKNQHAIWNEMIHSVKRRLASSNLRKTLSPLTVHGFNEFHVDLIFSQLRLAIMESSYALVACRIPCFFRTFLRVYSVGHLPCGWVGGEFPHGRLIAY